MQCLKNVGNTIKTSSNHLSKINRNESIEGLQHGPGIRTIVIGEQQKIFLSPRVEVRRVVKQIPATLIDRQQTISTGNTMDDTEPRIQIISKPMQRALNSPPGLHHVRVIKDGRFYEDHLPINSRHSSATPTSPQIDFSNDRNGFHHSHQTSHQIQPNHCDLSPEHHHVQQTQHQQSSRKYIVSRQINVISTSDQNVFRTPPVVSSTTQQQTSNNLQKQQMQHQQHQQQQSQQMTSMRPPPPPPPIMHRVKTNNSMSEEPSSSIPDLGKFCNLIYNDRMRIQLIKSFL